MKIAYADPPYPGCAHRYKDEPEYAGEVDHEDLCFDLYRSYDGFVLHTSSTALTMVLDLLDRAACAMEVEPSHRTMVWTKPFAAFKRNVSVAYAWEPVIVKACRKPVVSGRCVMRDYILCPITMKKGLCGAKPPDVIRWAFEVVGAQPLDALDDLYPGTGVVGRTWKEWCRAVRRT